MPLQTPLQFPYTEKTSRNSVRFTHQVFERFLVLTFGLFLSSAMPPKVNNKYATNKNPWFIKMPWELCVKSKPKGSTGVEKKRTTSSSLGPIQSIVVAKQTKIPTLTFTTEQGCWNLRGETWVACGPKTGSLSEVNAIMDPSMNSMNLKQRLGNYFIVYGFIVG